MSLAIFLQLMLLVAVDLICLVLVGLVLVLLAGYKKAAWAVLRRNFVGYFSNPTGYVFLCLFVFLTSIAAFWPHEFFVANLANLDQLNKWMPAILLVFVPAITMSIWADERRQGTDELLLTLPAADFDIVIGKYLAAAAIFTVSLLFSQVAIYTLLSSLAYDLSLGIVDIDTGLFFTTYFGYWMMGLAMLAIGMVASFLTPNLTVSFILGMLFNAIPVVTYYADVLVPASVTARQISQWSFAAQFDDFGRGVISFSSIAFFLLIIALGIYLSMVLIGKRHWLRHDGGPASINQQLLGMGGMIIAIAALVGLMLAPILVGENSMVALIVGLVGAAVGLGMYWAAGAMANPPHSGSMVSHYVLRTLTLIVLLVGVNSLLKSYDYLAYMRYDATAGEISSLSADTKRLLKEISAKDKRPVFVDAYISAVVPEEYVKTRYSLVSMLKELQRQSGGRVQLRLHDNLELFSEAAAQAEERFGIRPQTITSQARGALKDEQFIMGVAFTCGLEKVVVESFKLGMPVEYELIRSIVTVAGDERKKLGVVNTDAQMMGGFIMQGMQPRNMPKQLMIEELERQYKVEEVDPTNPIEMDRYDVLLVVQPSSLGPLQLANVVEAIRKGQPAAVFEDPVPIVMNQAVGTADEKPPQGGFMGMGGMPQPKGDIRSLWNLLGIQVTGEAGNALPPPAKVVWQSYNPYPRLEGLSIGPELVFLRSDMPFGGEPFNLEHRAVAGFEEVLFPYPTGISQKLGSDHEFIELVRTAKGRSGAIDATTIQMVRGDPNELEKSRGKPTDRSYCLAAWIRGKSPSTSKSPGKTSEQKAEGEGAEARADSAGADAANQPKPVNVIYVADIDLLSSYFVQLRDEPNQIANFRFDNVPFVCNLIDAVAGEERFLDIRKRKPKHSTLRMVELKTAAARDAARAKSDEIKEQFEAADKKAKEESEAYTADVRKVLDDLRLRQEQGEEVDPAEIQAKITQRSMQEAIANLRHEVTKQRLQRERDQAKAKIERERDQDIQKIQNDYKVRATAFPPILPLLIGLGVWARRRVREREGVSRSRMRT